VFSRAERSSLGDVIVYLPIVSGEVHLKLRYFKMPCTSLVPSIESQLTAMDWWGDYVR